MKDTLTLTEFANDTLKGLSSDQKYLSSKYFYDEIGSKIFQDIMRMPEYYLTRCEHEIFTNSKQQILECFKSNNRGFELIELGAGDGAKTKVLLSHFLDKKADFRYSPIDISEISVTNLVFDLENMFPELTVTGRTGDYFTLINSIKTNDYERKVILFLGSNIGNFNSLLSNRFLMELKKVCNPDDYVFIGFDLKKDKDIILRAYNDPHGHTAAFNLNLLRRINFELSADFDPANFYHEEVYDSESGTARSYLISNTNHSVVVQQLNEVFNFRVGEKIYMEMSQKYDLDMINKLAKENGFGVVKNFFDKRQFFVNSLWKPISVL